MPTPTPDDLYRLINRESNDDNWNLPSLDVENKINEEGETIGWESDFEQVSRDLASSELEKIIAGHYHAQVLFYDLSEDADGYHEKLLLGNKEEGWAIELSLYCGTYSDEDCDASGNISVLVNSHEAIEQVQQEMFQGITDGIQNKLQTELSKLLKFIPEQQHAGVIKTIWESFGKGGDASKLFANVVKSQLTQQELDHSTPVPRKVRNSNRM